nr:FecR family protein [Parabacteroides goldsteinii]
MHKKEVQNIIRLFFGKRFSKEAQLRFRYWFRSEEDHKEKEDTLRELWEASPSVTSEQTWEQLAKIRVRIAQNKENPIPVRYRLRYAAVAAIWLLTMLGTWYFSVQPAKEISPKLTEFYVPYGDRQEITLSDGTTVWVNAGSVLIYPSEFKADTRTVFLSGEAYFNVAKNPEQPFIVSTQHLDVQALGTMFSVDAYPGASETVATLEEGSIQVDVKSAEVPVSVLKPNEQLVYSHETHQFRVNKVDAEQVSAWKDGYLIFKDATFEEVIVALERKYNVTINYNAEKYKERTYYVKFNPDESIEDALTILSHLIEHFRYKVNGKTISIN